MNNRTLRRYTPPTCTLEVSAAESALSRWASQPVLKNLRFQLSFDDPRLPSDQRVLVRGDRSQLEALTATVETYVQQFLSGDAAAGATAGAPEGISLQPQGLLNHELHLGSLAANSTHPTVRLSTLQLSDLAAALDEYTREAVAIPTLNPSRGFTLPPAWLQVAAAALVTVGLSATVLRLLTPSPPMPTSATNSPAAETEIALDPPSSPTPLAVPPPPIVGSPGPTAGASPTAPLSTAPAAKAPAPAPTPGTTQKTAPNPPGAILFPSTPGERPRTASGGNNPLNLPPLPPLPPPLPAAQPSIAAAPVNPASARQAPSQEAGANQVRRSQTADSAFDAVPQVAEVRGYFQQRWQPPQGLTQTLEYSLLLNPDGSLQRIVPLGQSALTYIDQTGMPRAGEPFVSTVSNGTGVRIRLVLSPDGKVQTFQE